MKLRAYIFAVTVIFVTSCANVKKPTTKTQAISKIPKLPSKTLPGGDSDDWRYLGTNQQLVVEISESSITPTSTTQIYSFIDRKRIIDMDKFKYADSTKYKYILGTWLINCAEKQYQAVSASLYTDLGVKIKDIDYKRTNPDWITILPSSISQMQYDYVCLGINRNLGY